MITTVTTITTIAAMGLTSAVGIAAVVVLMLFLVLKELSGASQSPFLQLTSRLLTVGIIPLAIVFAVTVTVRIFEVLV